MTPDQEAKIGEKWLEMARAEGHAPKLPFLDPRPTTRRMPNGRLRHETVYEMLDAGGSPTQIARILGVTKAAILYHKRRKAAGL
ncbi:MAG: hypothetical protein RQ750_16850 [Roseovarius sp.]|nr:hypothetical protein [Roseovarius sp.]